MTVRLPAMVDHHCLYKIILYIALLFPCWSLLGNRILGRICSQFGCRSQQQLLPSGPTSSSRLQFKDAQTDGAVLSKLSFLDHLSPVTIQIANSQDLPSIVSLRTAAFYPVHSNDLVFRETMLEKIRRRLLKGSKFLLALRDNSIGQLPPNILPEGCLYGTAEFNSFDFQNTSMEHIGSHMKLYIGDLAVRQDARRLGIATSLLRAIETYALQNGFDELYLHVEMFNEPARKLYRKHGFFEEPHTQQVSNFTEQLLSRPADSFSLMCKRLWIS